MSAALLEWWATYRGDVIFWSFLAVFTLLMAQDDSNSDFW
jgi:hypothetical protein